MNFIQLINDQQHNLNSYDYVNKLWSDINENALPTFSDVEEETLYRSHIPIQFCDFLKQCVEKLHELKLGSVSNAEWSKLDPKYLNTLIYFALGYEDVTMDTVLYAANMFVLLNSISVSQFFNQSSYVKILLILQNFTKSQDLISSVIVSLMDDFKTFLSSYSLPDNLVMPTISMLHDYTYFCNDTFEDFTIDVSHENLGYITFICLKVLLEQISQQQLINRKHLYAVFLCLTSSLKSAATNNISRSVKLAHQNNVRLFMKQNFNQFSSSFLTDMLKFVSMSTDYDEFEAIALLIQQLPCETYQSLISALQTSMFSNKVEHRKKLINLVLPIFHHPPADETGSKHLIRAEIFTRHLIMLFMDTNQQVRENSVKVVAEFSEDILGKRILKKIMVNSNSNINRNSIQDVLYRMLDKGWSNKSLNTNYINLMCNLLLIRKDLVTLKALNRLREICTRAAPIDLKPCMAHLKQLLVCYPRKTSVVMYVLSIYIKQILHPMATSAFFAKDLHEFIFSHISHNKQDEFIWDIIDHLISNNFDITAVFEKFKSLNLLSKQHVQTILECKVHNNNKCAPALKLLGILLQFVPYDDCYILHKKLEAAIDFQGTNMSELKTELYLTIYALIKIIEKKNVALSNIEEINEYRRMQVLVFRTFYDQSFPSSCVNYVTTLLTLYANLIEEDIGWDEATCSRIEEDLSQKLVAILNRKLDHFVYISRDISYISELIILCNTRLQESNFEKLKKIVTVTKHSSAFSKYIRSHPDIWTACIRLYIKVCFVNSELIADCVSNLELILCDCNEQLQIQILYALLDMCNMHLQYYDPLVPHLFEALHSKNAYIRFISSKLIALLITDGHLRLMDAQYLLFMGLLSDKKDIVVRNVEKFVKEKFGLQHNQLIARYFVPSIIHYNCYYHHPTIALSKFDQDLIKQRIYSWKDRTDIYCYLFQFLSDNNKFNILNQIQSEILARVLNRTLVWSSDVIRILEDSLTVILYIVSKEKIARIKNDREYYNGEIKRISSDLIINPLRCSESNDSREKRTALKNVLTVLLKLLFSDFGKTTKNFQNLLYTIVVLTDNFYNLIKCIVIEESSLLKRLYKNLAKMYTINQHKFDSCMLTVNPYHFSVNEEKDEEFFIDNSKYFELISPHVINGIKLM